MAKTKIEGAMNKTKIEYLTHTWNPLAMRCTPVSNGCANCWHLARAGMLAANPKISEEVRQAYSGKTSPILIKSRIDAPLRFTKPAIIGVQFMGDLFHKDVPFSFIASIWDRMFDAPQHTYMILTKRPERMVEFALTMKNMGRRIDYPNVWFGVTVENQETVDKRIPILLQIPAAVRFVSCEPLLGPVNLSYYVEHVRTVGSMSGAREIGVIGLDWVIAGCESGPNRRPTEIEWFRAIQDGCEEEDVPFFLKQMDQGGRVIHMPLLDGREWNEMPR